MNRRTFLAAATTVGGFGGGGYLYSTGRLDTLFAGQITSVDWAADGRLAVGLEEGHDVTTIVMLRPGDEVIDGPVGEWSVSAGQTSLELDVIKGVGPEDSVPAEGWKLLGLDDSALEDIFRDKKPEEHASVTFDFDFDLDIVAVESGDQGYLDVTVVNSGPAPARASALVGEVEQPLSGAVYPGGEEVFRGLEVLERGGGCVDVPPELPLSLFAAPSAKLTTTHTFGDEAGRHCRTSL